jgi:hypothetical protein
MNTIISIPSTNTPKNRNNKSKNISSLLASSAAAAAATSSVPSSFKTNSIIKLSTSVKRSIVTTDDYTTTSPLTFHSNKNQHLTSNDEIIKQSLSIPTTVHKQQQSSFNNNKNMTTLFLNDLSLSTANFVNNDYLITAPSSSSLINDSLMTVDNNKGNKMEVEAVGTSGTAPLSSTVTSNYSLSSSISSISSGSSTSDRSSSISPSIMSFSNNNDTLNGFNSTNSNLNCLTTDDDDPLLSFDDAHHFNFDINDFLNEISVYDSTSHPSNTFNDKKIEDNFNLIGNFIQILSF